MGQDCKPSTVWIWPQNHLSPARPSHHLQELMMLYCSGVNRSAIPLWCILMRIRPGGTGLPIEYVDSSRVGACCDKSPVWSWDLNSQPARPWFDTLSTVLSGTWWLFIHCIWVCRHDNLTGGDHKCGMMVCMVCMVRWYCNQLCHLQEVLFAGLIVHVVSWVYSN